MLHFDLCMDLCKKLAQTDIEGVVLLLTDDVLVEYPAVPAQFQNKKEFIEMLGSFFDSVTQGGVKFQRMSLSEEGPVWIERVHHWKIGEQWIDIPTVGIFEVKNEQVDRWTEYLDVRFLEKFPKKYFLS